MRPNASSTADLLSDTAAQLEIINRDSNIPPFETHLSREGLSPLTANNIEVLQLNLGSLCNQTCSHCHVNAGPNRREIMSKETMQACLTALDSADIPTIDITGGAPEMNPNFQWLVRELKQRNHRIIVRSNLTILLSKPFTDYPGFYQSHQVELISSLPCYSAENTDAQRGKNTFKKSIQALKHLNSLGYGQENSGLALNLVYNPGGAFLPPDQSTLEAAYKQQLKENYGIVFNHLYTITNMPISRFLLHLLDSNHYPSYMKILFDAYNPRAAHNVMCRKTLSVSWDGYLYDCDFNQMLELPAASNVPTHIRDFDWKKLSGRFIITGQHCYGCTAGAGSSCSGTII